MLGCAVQQSGSNEMLDLYEVLTPWVSITLDVTEDSLALHWIPGHSQKSDKTEFCFSSIRLFLFLYLSLQRSRTRKSCCCGIHCCPQWASDNGLDWELPKLFCLTLSAMILTDTWLPSRKVMPFFLFGVIPGEEHFILKKGSEVRVPCGLSSILNQDWTQGRMHNTAYGGLIPDSCQQ